MNKTDYDKLTKIVKKMSEDKYSTKFLDEVYKLAYMLFDVCEEYFDYFKYEDKTPFNLNESIKESYEFLNSINKDYGERFLNILYNDENITFKKITNDIEEDSHVLADGHIYITYSNTISDIYNIVHEFLHKLIISIPRNEDDSIDENEFSLVEDFFGEIPTINIELLLNDYLYNKYKNKNDIKNNISDMFIYYWNISLNYIIKYDLIKLYRENNTLNENIISNYINNISHDNIRNIIYNNYYKTELIDEEDDLYILESSRYIIGICGASYLYKNKEYNKLFSLNHIIGNANYEIKKSIKTLNKLKFPFIKKGDLYINENNLKEIRENIESILCQNLEINNKKFR